MPPETPPEDNGCNCVTVRQPVSVQTTPTTAATAIGSRRGLSSGTAYDLLPLRNHAAGDAG